MRTLACLWLVAAAAAPAAEQSASTAHHHAGVDARGATVMGFDQAKTVHRFRLHADGGSIDVAVKDPTDHVNLEAIRRHLPHVAHLFQQGRFDLPMLVHAADVPGTRELTRLHDTVRYTFVETPSGGRVDIVTTHGEALSAIHRFLAFQIADHRTGDPAAITPR